MTRSPSTLNSETTLLVNFTNENTILANAYIVIEISKIEEVYSEYSIGKICKEILPIS